MPSIPLLITQQQRYFPIVYKCLWRVQFFADDPTDFRKIAAEFHRKINDTEVRTYRKGSEKDIIYLDTNFHCILGFSSFGTVDLEEMRLKIRKKLREVGKRMAVVVYIGEVNYWKMYLIPEVENEETE